MRLAVACGVVAFILGVVAGSHFWTKPPETKTTTEKHVETDTTTHKETQVVVVKEPQGKETITTTIIEDTKTNKDETKEKSKTKVKDTGYGLTVSAIAATTVKDFRQPTYGVGVTKEVLGPISAGAMILTDGTFGVSIGFSF